ncbi:hypothetical protein ACWDXV_32530 [Nocardia nova]
MDLPALPFGLWISGESVDYIVHRTGCSGYYRDHIVLHEVCHMLAGHSTVEATALGTEDIALSLSNNPLTSFQEEMAEAFAARLLKMSHRPKRRPADGFEYRASRLLGTNSMQ